MNIAALLLTLTLFADERACADADEHGRNDEAIACYQRLLQDDRDPPARLRFLSRLAWLHWKRADFENALLMFNEGLALARETHNRAVEGQATNFIGLLHQMLGDPATALAHYESALSIACELDDRKLLGSVEYHLGWVNFVRGDFAVALRHYERSLSLRRELGDRQGEAHTLLGLGMTNASLSRFEPALALTNEALEMFLALGDRPGEANARDNLGTTLTALHRGREAIAQHAIALQIRRDGGQHWSEMISLSGAARAHHEQRELDQAVARMNEVVDIIEEGRRRLSREAFRASLYASAHGHYERYIAYLMERGDAAAAFTASERSRARLMLDAIQDARVRNDAAPLRAEEIQSAVLDEGTVLVEYSLGAKRASSGP